MSKKTPEITTPPDQAKAQAEEKSPYQNAELENAAMLTKTKLAAISIKIIKDKAKQVDDNLGSGESNQKKFTGGSFKKHPGLSHRELADREQNPIYSPDSKTFGEERESKVIEWKTGFIPFIVPTHLRKHRRGTSYNPHFWKYPKSKWSIRRVLLYRLGVIEISLQNGLGARYRLSPAKGQSFDFPMTCVSNLIYGNTCGTSTLRRAACLEILLNWETYKWEVKAAYAYHIDYFRRYDPLDENEEAHENARFLYKVAVFNNMYDSKRIELTVACVLHEYNFYTIESQGDEVFRVIPTGTSFNKSIYFFSKEIPYSGKMIDHEIRLYKNYYLVWLCPIIPASGNLIMTECKLRITYSNPEIGYFHLFEEDPRNPIEKFNSTANKKRTRHHFVQFSPVVHTLYYYQEYPFRIWDSCCRLFGFWLPREVDERIAGYSKYQIDRFHRLEQEFIRAAEISIFNQALDKRQRRKISRQVEDFLAFIKSPEDNPEPPLFHYAEKIRKMYYAKDRRIKMIYKLRNQNNTEFQKKHPKPPSPERHDVKAKPKKVGRHPPRMRSM